jgi:hypothetical protein
MSDLAVIPTDEEVVLDKPRVTDVVDGYLVDSETGEVLGLEKLPKEEFKVDSESAAEWVLNKMLEAESDVAAVDSSPFVIHARTVLQNAEKLKKEKQGRVDWLHKRFDAELGAFARIQLANKKGRTFKAVVGSIALRKVVGGLRVKDEAAALRVAKMCYPHAVKTTHTFMISQLTPADIEELKKGLAEGGWKPDDYTRTAFEIKPDEEKVDVKTGVGK